MIPITGESDEAQIANDNGGRAKDPANCDACMVSKLIVRVYGIEYVWNGRMQVRLEDVGNVCVPYLENCSSIA